MELAQTLSGFNAQPVRCLIRKRRNRGFAVFSFQIRQKCIDAAVNIRAELDRSGAVQPEPFDLFQKLELLFLFLIQIAVR